MRETTFPENLAEQFRLFAFGVRRDHGAQRYARICEGVASDEPTLALVAGAPPAQRRPNILLAAVHYLLLSGVDDPLARHYPTVLAWRGEDAASALGPEVADPYPPFAAFVARHRDPLAELIATRATQTNEVGRCTAILPALSTVAERTAAPLAIVDLGAAAGLNLLFDQYAYDYRPEPPSPARDGEIAGRPDSPVVLRCDVREGWMPTVVPRIASRVGLDRMPVDVRDDDQARWLLACQWPDNLERFEVARAAIDAARSVPDPPVVHRGDALGDLDTLVAAIASDAHVCVLHTWVAAYFTPEEQRALGEVIAGIGASRPVSWLFAEAPYEVPGLPVPPPPGDKVRGATAVVLVEHAPGSDPVARRLADMHSHGRWLHWYGAEGR